MDIETARNLVLREGWLTQTPDWFRQAVVGHCQLRTFKKGDWLYKAGDPPSGLFGLVAGGLAVELSATELGPFIGGFARPGMWYGEGSVLSGAPRQIGLFATRPSHLLYLSLPAIQKIVATDASAWRFIALVALRQLYTFTAVLEDHMNRAHDKRLIAMLLHLVGCRHATPAGYAPVEIDIGHDGLATLSNLARTTTGAVLRRLEKAGHVELAYRRIRIVDPDALRAMLAA